MRGTRRRASLARACEKLGTAIRFAAMSAASLPPVQPAPLRGWFLWFALVLLALVLWQGWMICTLFAAATEGGERFAAVRLLAAWDSLCDDRPLLSGMHPLHLYHGFLGAVSFLERDTFCCYDPAFQAGYPKTPVFDSGSRPAELFLTLVGGTYQPSAYKMGLAICLLAFPLAFYAAAWCTGLSPGASCLSTALALLALWSQPGRQLLETGELDLLLAGAAGLMQCGLLLRHTHRPGLGSWLSLFLCGTVGYFSHPALYGILSLLVLVYYLSVGPQHGLAWHLALWSALAGALVVNGFWLPDWLAHWWIRSPLRLGVPLLPHRTLPNVWSAPLWGTELDRVLVGALVPAAAVGSLLFARAGWRAAARLYTLGLLVLLFLAVAGLASEALGTLGTTRLLVPALWFAAVPAAHAATRLLQALGGLVGAPWRGAALAAVALAAATIFAGERFAPLVERAAGTQAFQLGLSADQRALVEILSRETTNQGRILWEDHPASRGGTHWTALLPKLTERAYISGLDIDRCIEHAYPAFTDQHLAGRPLRDWTDGGLEEFTRRYAVGWVACWSQAAKTRFAAWSQATATTELPGGGQLFSLRPPSVALRGAATLLHADCRRIVLSDVTPDEEGRVVLSLHYQAGFRAVPSRVQIERDPDAHDPIPFIRLRMSGPLPRVTLEWEGR